MLPGVSQQEMTCSGHTSPNIVELSLDLMSGSRHLTRDSREDDFVGLNLGLTLVWQKDVLERELSSADNG